MTARFRISERVQWYEFIIFMVLLFGPIAVLAVIGNTHPERISTLQAVSIIIAAVIVSVTVVAVRKRGRILAIDDCRIKLLHEKNGHIIADFDLSTPHSLAFAIRESLTGKSGKAIKRWIQLFIAQNGALLKLESPQLEKLILSGNSEKKWQIQVGGSSSQILALASEKTYCHDETESLRKNNKTGSAAYGLPSFYEGASEDVLKAVIDIADRTSGNNTMLLKPSGIRGSNVKFSEFMKEFKKTFLY